MKDSEHDIIIGVSDKSTVPAILTQPERGIEVTAEVTLGNNEHREQIKIHIAPNVATLLPQVENLMNRIHARARGMMFKRLADEFIEISMSGIYPEYKHEALQAHAIISVPGGSVAIINGIEVDFFPRDIAESMVFELDKIEWAQERLIMQLLARFSAL